MEQRPDRLVGRGLAEAIVSCMKSYPYLMRTYGALGLGVQYGLFAFDYAFVAHPYLAGQHRLSFEMGLWTGKAR